MEVIQIIFSAIIFLSCIYFLGNILSIPFQLSSDSIQSVFYKLSFGVTGGIIFSSLYCTFFKTINVLLIPILIYLLKYRKKDFRFAKINFQNFRLELKSFLFCIFALVCIIFIQFYRIDFFNPEVTYLSQPDFSFYAVFAEYLYKIGIERLAPWFELNELSATGQVDFYHYGDLWFLGSFYQFTNIAPLKIYLFIYIPIGVTISFVGLHALFSLITKKGKHSLFAICCFFIVFSIGAIPFYRFGFGMQDSPLTKPKVFLFFIFMTLAMMALFKNKYRFFVISISVIPIFNIIYAPHVFTSIFFWSAFLFWKNRKWKYCFGMIFPSIVALGIIGFYMSFGGSATSYDVSLDTTLHQYFQDFFITVFRNILARTVLFHTTMLTLFFLFWKKRNHFSQLERDVFTFVLLLISTTIFFRGILNFHTESFQIYQLTLNSLFTILYVYFFALFVKNKSISRRYKNLVFGLILFNTASSFYVLLNQFPQRYEGINTEILNQMSAELEEVNPIGVFITSKENLDYLTESATVCFFAAPLKMMGHYKWVNSISVPENLEDLAFRDRIKDVSSSPFFRFIQKQKTEGEFITYEKSQRDFIEKNKVEYVWIEKGGVLPKELEAITLKIIEDKKSGIRLGIFQHKK